jgi:hypothetical protein
MTTMITHSSIGSGPKFGVMRSASGCHRTGAQRSSPVAEQRTHGTVVIFPHHNKDRIWSYYRSLFQVAQSDGGAMKR